MRKTLLMVLLFTGYWANANQLKSITTPPQENGKPQKLNITVSDKGHISLWDINTGHAITGVLIPSGLSVDKFSYNSEENYVAAICSKTVNEAQLFIWKPTVDKGKFIKLSKTKKVNDIRICNDNRNILVSYADNSVEYIAIATMQVVMQISSKIGAVNLKEIIINKSQNFVIVPCTNGVCVYDLDTKTLVKELNIEAEKITFSPNGKTLLIKTQEKVRMYTTQTWSLIMEKDAALLDLADKKRATYLNK